MNFVSQPIEADGIDERRQVRKQNVSSMTILLPPDLALAIRLTAHKSGMSPESLVTDVLRDIFESTFAGRGEVAADKAEQE